MKILKTKKNKDKENVYEIELTQKVVKNVEYTQADINKEKENLIRKIDSAKSSIAEMQEYIELKEFELSQIEKVDALIKQ